jgi:Ca2+/Na+ antiporter
MLLSAKSLFILLCMLFLTIQPAFVYGSTHNVTPAQWKELTADKAFSYKKDKQLEPPPKEYKRSAIAQFFSWLIAFLFTGAGNVIVWIIVLAILGYIVYSVFFRNSFFFAKNRKMIPASGADGQDGEDIATTNWEALLQKATENNDLRLAVRYSYMWLLQILQQQELIKYRTDKTNYEYYTELNETQYKQPFKQLSRQYEYAWYGQFNISATTYNDYISLFNNVRNQLSA